MGRSLESTTVDIAAEILGLLREGGAFSLIFLTGFGLFVGGIHLAASFLPIAYFTSLGPSSMHFVLLWYFDRSCLVDADSENSVGTFPMVWPFWWLTTAASISYLLFRLVASWRSRRRVLGVRLDRLRDDALFFPSLFFFSANVITTLFYYAYVYDERGTYKPAWTEKPRVRIFHGSCVTE